MKLWRICKQRHAATAFSGEGARLAFGRWNSLGVPMVYASLSLSLAVLEVFVHLDPEDEPDDLVSIMAEVPKDERFLEQEKMLMRLKLPQDWRAVANHENQQMGDAWIRSKESLSLLVPSAVVEDEWNVLLNPEHPDAAKIHVVETKAFRFDARMFRS
jgi:RES domain-containing protein